MTFTRKNLQLLVLTALAVGVIAVVYRITTKSAAKKSAPPMPAVSSPSSEDMETSSRDQIAVLPLSTTSWEEFDDPAKDGWTTEVLSDLAHQQLKTFGRLLIAESPIAVTAIEQLFAEPKSARLRLQPRTLREEYNDGAIKVERLVDSKPGEPQALTRAIEEFAGQWSSRTQNRIAFKVVGINRISPVVFETRNFVSISGKSDAVSVEQHATWTTKWQLTEAKSEVRILGISLDEFEQVTGPRQRLFSDCTASVLSNNACYERQFLFGLNHWLERNQDMRYFSPLGNPGIAIGDINGDGMDDIYVCQESHLPNRLFLQQPDGTAADVSKAWGVDWLESTRSALFIDIDNDGDQDLVAAILGGVVIASNEGSRFKVRTVLATSDDTTSLSAADYDADGDLDLYVCVDYPDDHFAAGSEENSQATVVQVGATSRVYHDANTAGSNSLFRNDIDGDDWDFTDVTAASGMDENNRRFTWSASWEDFDNDGDQDLYVANDFGRNNLYQNTNGTFKDIAASANAEDSASGMSVAWGDPNRDGNMDLYVANMFSSAGSRISHQPQFKQDSTSEVRSRLQRFARGSTLLSNNGDSSFADRSVQAGVNLGRWSWSSNFIDINNDGWQDLAVANGYITADDNGDL